MTAKGLHRPKEPETSKREFLQAALELFSQKGYYRTSVDDIIRRAGRSKGGFYHHFKSKNSLLHSMFHQMMREFGTILLDEIKSGKSLEAAFKNYINSPPIQTVLNSSYLKAIAELYALALTDRKMRELLVHFHQDTSKLFEQVLEIARSRGEISYAAPTRTLADSIYHSMRGSMLINIILHEGRGLLEEFDFLLQRTLRELRAK
ncbi:MAG: TetR/AcrR family transcriptional regulator [candidate division FCPU426 bacterium]